MPQLRRLIVVDSYAASRIRELRLDGHVHVSGRNGRGKTTLIRLIPLFYGEQPSKMVRSAGSVVRSLREFMFSRSTSYVAFEYENHDGIKLAILHYGADNSPQYHLADGGYAREIFVDNDSLLEGRQLNRRLSSLGRNPSPALGVLHYRAIIQGSTARLGNALQRQLPRRFALIQGRSKLAGIERISSGMFSKDISFDLLKRMAASVAYDEEDKQIVLNLSRRELESFLPDFKAYRAVMALEPHWHSANLAHVAASEARHQQALAAGRLKRLVLALGQWSQHCRETARQEEEALAAVHHEARDTQARFELALHSLQSEIERLTHAILQADREAADWRAKDIHALIEQVAQRRAREANVMALEARQNALLAQQESVTRKYQALFAEEKNRRQQLETEAAARLAAQIDELQQQQAAVDDARETARAQLHAAQQTALDLARTAWEESLGGVSALDQQQAQLAPDEALHRAVDAASGAVDAAEAARVRVGAEDTAARLAEQAAQHAIANHEQHTARLTQKHTELAHQRARLQTLENPDPASLLHFLRTQRPDWHGDIARLIREDLLLQTDLAPGLVEGESFYGVALDLRRIDVGRAASEQQLAAQIERARTQEADATQAMTDAKRRHATLTDALNAARSQRLASGAQCQRAAADIGLARQTLLAAQKQCRDELDQRRRQLQARRLEAQAQAGARKAALDQRQQEHAQASDAQRHAFDARSQAIRLQQIKARECHADELAALRTEQGRVKEALDKQRLVELSNSGVDTHALQFLEAEMHAARARVDESTAAAPHVEAHARWQATVPPQRERDLARREQQRDDERRLRSAHAETLAIQQARLEHQAAQLTAAEEKSALATRRLNDAEQAQQARLAGIESGISDASDAIALHWLLPDILTQLDAATSVLHSQQHQLKAHLGSLVRSFRRQDFIATKVGEFALHLSDDYLNDIEPTLALLTDWYTTAHAQHRDVLGGQLRNGCGMLRRFHDALLDFQSHIGTLSRELQASLSADLVFEAIRRLAIRLSAQVENRVYWDALVRVLAEHDRWQEEASSELPGDALLDELQNFARHLPDGALNEPPEALMEIEIEVDDGTDVKHVRNEADLKQVSSNGLSYLVLCLIFVAFANRARRHHEQLWLSWALDEIGTIDEGNARALLSMLNKNHIHLVSASPEAKESLQTLFDHRYEVLPEFEIRRLINDDEIAGIVTETP